MVDLVYVKIFNEKLKLFIIILKTVRDRKRLIDPFDSAWSIWYKFSMNK